jgi:hypothetical protein
MSGQCDFDLEFLVDQPSSDFCSNLSGLFFFLDPLAVVGFAISQLVGQIPYVLLGSTWGLRKKHEGTDTRQAVQGKLSETHTTEFATAGRDAFAMVAFLPYFMGSENSQQYNL